MRHDQPAPPFPDLPGLTFALVPELPAYALASDLSLWSTLRRGRRSERAAYLPTWTRRTVTQVGRRTKRPRAGLWDGSRLLYYYLDELHCRLFARAQAVA